METTSYQVAVRVNDNRSLTFEIEATSVIKARREAVAKAKAKGYEPQGILSAIRTEFANTHMREQWAAGRGGTVI